jgi:RNA polymerase subunit RPABC4/transcription elongation factor Spt4
MDEVCPQCGSSMTTDELFDVTAELDPSAPLIMDITNAPGPRDKAPTRIQIKNELHRDSGRFQQAHRTFDKQNDRYRETITDYSTGEVVVEKDEPLSKHRGRGSARRGRR